MDTKTDIGSQSLTVEFNSATRSELYAFFTALLKSIPNDIITGQCLITVNGDPDTGKSMLWDIARELFHKEFSELGDRSITEYHRIPQSSDAEISDIRINEIYEDASKITTPTLRLLFVNAHGLSTHQDAQSEELLERLVKLENSISNDNAQPDSDLGNVIILNNVMPFNGFKGKNTPVRIKITDPTMAWSGTNTHWNRRTVVEFNHPDLVSAASVREFVQNYG